MGKIMLIGVCGVAGLATAAAGAWVYAGEWGHTGSGPGEFNRPRDVGVNPSGTVYVVDTDNLRIQYFTATGRYLGEWHYSAFLSPAYVDFAANGNVYVADKYDGVFLFSPTGSYINCIQTWDGGYSIYQVHGLAVSRGDGYVYASVYGHNSFGYEHFKRVYKMNPSLYANLYFDTPSTGPLTYSPLNPWLYLYRWYPNPPVLVYNSSGSLLFSWGTYGSGPGSLYSVQDMATAPNGDVYVVESINRFQWFTATGSFKGYYAGDFNGPRGIGLSPDGETLYIADTGNDRIQYFRWSNETNVRPTSLGKLKALFK